jgi:small subunit ribosomal protein S17
MAKRVAIGLVTSAKTAQTRRVEIPRLIRHKKYGKIVKRRTICYVDDPENNAQLGDTVEIRECPPKSRLKRWELVKVIERSRAVDIAAMRAAARQKQDTEVSV